MYIPVTKRREKKKRIADLTDDQKLSILESYSQGQSVVEIAKELSVDSQDVDSYITAFYSNMVNTRQTNALRTSLVASGKASAAKGNKVIIKSKFRDPNNINEDFLSKLSDWDSTSPSDAEHHYAYTYGHTGNNKRALKEAGLLAKHTSPSSTLSSMNHMRGVYLRDKPIVDSIIKSIQKENLDRLNVDKDYVQTNLIQNIEELKEEVADRPMQRGNLIKSIELLGKTIGAFTEKISIEEVSPNKALDTMIEMAKAKVIEGPPEEEWEPSNEG
jgi:hypothetical protein